MSDRPTPGHDLQKFADWVERDRHEPDKLLCHVQSMRRAGARSQGLEEAASFALAAIPSKHPEPCGTDACWLCAAETKLREALGLPDEEGEPSALTAMPVAYGAAPPPRGAAREGADLSREDMEALQRTLRGVYRLGDRTSIARVQSWLRRQLKQESPSVRDVTGEGER